MKDRITFEAVTQVIDDKRVLIGTPVDPVTRNQLIVGAAALPVKCARAQVIAPCQVVNSEGQLELTSALYVYDHHGRAMLLSLLDSPVPSHAEFNLN